MAGLSVVLTLRDPVPLANAWMVVAAFALLIGIGEYYRFGIDEGRQLAPMTLGAGLAFALTSRSWNIDLTTLSPSPIIAVSGLPWSVVPCRTACAGDPCTPMRWQRASWLSR